MRKKILKILRGPYEWARKHPPVGAIMYFCLKQVNNAYDRYYRRQSSPDLPTIFRKKPELAEKVLVVSVAFNNSDLIEKQIECFRKNVSPTAVLLVADNSTTEAIREKIRELCQAKNVLYLSLPDNPRKQPNLSHSITLNWLYYNLIKKIQPYGFGFIDHDIFPSEPTDIKTLLEQTPLYGLYQERASGSLHAWYLWAGFCFYRYEYVKSHSFDFNSVAVTNWHNLLELDSGGGNWRSLYSNLPPHNVQYARQSRDHLNIEHIDGWRHIGGSSFKNRADLQKLLHVTL